MRGLILDTSTERGIIAVVDGEKPLFDIQLPFGLQSSHFLLPELEAQLGKRQLSTADLDYIACGTGPGSYTGIRVAATVAKAIAFVHRIPLVGVGTMEAFVSGAPGPFAVVIDAKMGGVYLQLGEVSGNRGEALVRPLTEAAALLKEVDLLLTPHSAMLRPKLEALCPGKAWEWREMYPSAEAIARSALAKLERGDYLPDGFADSSLELQYLRKTQAEIEKGRLHT